ncbi:hypothetical protein LCGC14_0972650 [marine sediment metagenome]|uniref:Uncharacterized protein n=1 Tax=marine sediment metagenome TaxID=412755 RepID=A0A0F9NBB2_9ZZZZ
MREFVRSSLLKDHTMATEIIEEDLPISPLSHIILTIDFYNATDEATLAEVLTFINQINVSKSGVAILSLQSEDLYLLNCYLYRKRPVLSAKVATDNYNRSLSLIIPMGRKQYDPNECYPSHNKGDLTLFVDTTVPATTLDNAVVNIETVELPGATPKKYLKSTQKTVTAPGATGENDVSLPLGNQLVALGLRLTTWYTASTHVMGIENVKLLLNNSEYGYRNARIHCLVGDLINLLDTQHGSIAAQGLEPPLHAVFLDFDPVLNDEFLIDTKNLTDLKMRLDMGVDEATTVNIFELVQV